MKTLQYKTENNGHYDLITVYDEDGKIFTELEAGKFPDDNERFFTDEDEIQLYLDDNGYGDEEFEICPLTAIKEIFDTLEEWEYLNNKKEILKFMGVKPTFIFGHYRWSDSPHFSTAQDTEALALQSIAKYSKYDNDWNWLMKVVDKIENLGFEFYIVENRCRINHNTDKSIETVIDFAMKGTKIEAVYTACVEFIKWYNNERY